MKYIKDTNDRYAIDEEGNVYSFRKGKPFLLKPQESRFGYMVVFLNYESGKRARPIHRLLGEAFLEGYTDGCLVLHKNDIKTDNRLSNLYIGSRRDNAIDALVNGKNTRNVITTEMATKIRADLRHTPIGQIATKYGVSFMVVYNILTGRTWGHLGALNLTDEQMLLHRREALIGNEDVDVIREYYAKQHDKYTLANLAAHFNISQPTARRVIKGLGKFRHLPSILKRELKNGPTSSKQKITYADSLDILRRYGDGEVTQTQLAREYNIDLSSINRLVHGKYTYSKPKEVDPESEALFTSDKKQFTAKDVRKLRAEYKRGITPVRISEKYGVNLVSLRKAIRGEFDNSENLVPPYTGKLSTYGEGTYYARGAENAHSILTDEAVRWAKKVYKRGDYSKAQIAEHLGVSNPVIIYCIRGDTWQHV